jgi:hypothetical protein
MGFGIVPSAGRNFYRAAAKVAMSRCNVAVATGDPFAAPAAQRPASPRAAGGWDEPSLGIRGQAFTTHPGSTSLRDGFADPPPGTFKGGSEVAALGCIK